MSTRLLAVLEAVIDGFIQDNCEQEDWPDFYINEELQRHMAAAAYAVFMSSVCGQAFAKSQDSE